MFQPHDLLWLQPGAELRSDAPLPDWARSVLSSGHPVVVRRAARSPESIPVGLRGATRGQRFAAHVDAACVMKAIRPEALTGAVLSLPDARAGMAAFVRLEALLRELPVDQGWGPTGSVGFELATGIPVVKPGSDLDIIVRARSPISRSQARTLLSFFPESTCRCDVSLDTPNGGVSLLEWARGDNKVLLKTDSGPRLVADPWHYIEGSNP